MISFIQGKLVTASDNFVILNVNGLGLKVFCSPKLIPRLIATAETEKDITIFTFLSIKETRWDLFGFETKAELDAFELLISISGIGPKTALNILSVASVEEIEEAIILEDASILSKISGISKKNAQKIIVELKNKVKKISHQSNQKSTLAGEIEVIDALTELGYKLNEIRPALNSFKSKNLSIEETIRQILKILGNK
ncbi:MAG TPA: Holliday junction branch migration protein RuvA [Candidatus Portnoybacteria bacterium]|nr:Holliday junction branch migration protein RuvA [Candidatus Portnoybacteria bacterium]